MQYKEKRKIWGPAVLSAICIAIAMFALSGIIGTIPGKVHAEDGYDQELNMLDDEGYADFSLALEDPDEFYSDDHPLQNYDPNPLSWLYVGYMNKNANEANKGSYAVYNTMPLLTEKKATIYDPDHGIKDGEFQLNPVSQPHDYSGPNASKEGKKAVTVATNAVSVRRGVDQSEAVVELAIDHDRTDSKYQKDYLRLTLRQYKNGYTHQTAENIFTLANPGVYKDLDTRAIEAVTSMTAVDLDGDGYDEVAIYVADPQRPRVEIFRITDNTIESYFTGSGEWSKNVVDLSELNDPSDSYQFGKGYNSYNVPIVSLSSTRISGKEQEDLVITACVPTGTNTGTAARSKKSAIGIYSLDSGYGIQNQFLNHPEFANGGTSGKKDILRFISAADADLDGNGIKELAVGGYIFSQDAAQSSGYGLNFIIWHNDEYHMLYDAPLYEKPGNTSCINAHTGFAMSAPAIVEAAKLNSHLDKDFLMLENMILEFKSSDSQSDEDNKGDDDGYDELRKGSFKKIYELSTTTAGSWGEDHYISQAATGRFVQGNEVSEQIAVVIQNYHTTATNHREVSLSINWLWMENGIIAQHNTNPEYIKQRGATSYGTSIILCPVGNTGSTDYYQYLGKNYGWTMPTPIIAASAVPYWYELNYGGDPGTIEFTFSDTFSQAATAQLTLNYGMSIDISMEAGAKFLGNEVKIGAGQTLDVGGDFAFKFGMSHETTKEIKISGPGNSEQLLVYAKPVIVYNYKKYVPRTEMTQDMIQNYEEQTGQKPTKEGKPIEAGYIIEAGWYDYCVTKQCKGTFHMKPMDEYQRLYEKYKDKAIDVNMQDLFYNYTIGDPTTYPSNPSDIKTWITGEALSPLAQVSPKEPIIPGQGNLTTFTTSQSLSASGAASASFGFNQGMYGKGHVKLSLIASAEFGGQIGVKVGTVGAIEADIGLSVNGGLSGEVRSPTTTNTAYQFQTQMAAWAPFKSVPIAMGFLVSDAIDETPLPPFHPYVYATGKTWVMLAWEAPDLSNPRSADKYKIYQDDFDTALNDSNPVNADTQHFLVTGLDPDTSYSFHFAGMKGDIVGEKSATVEAKTLKDLGATVNGPSDQWVQLGESAEFSVAANIPDGYYAEYTWQQYEAINQYDGEWTYIPDEDGAILSVLAKDQDMDGTKYRVRVDVKKQTSIGTPGTVQQLYSRVATMHIGNDDRPRIDLTVLDESGNEIPEYNGEYYIETGKKVSFTATITDSDENPVTEGTVSFFDQINTTDFNTLGTSSLSNGSNNATQLLAVDTAGTYKVVAEYNTIPDKPTALSNLITLHAGKIETDCYRIRYELDGGENHPANPAALPYNAVRNGLTIVLEDAVKDYANFSGWYSRSNGQVIVELNESIINELADENGIITLYAQWDNIQYGVTYELNGGTDPGNPAEYTMYQKVPLKTPEKTGYQFLGWFTEASFENQITELPPLAEIEGWTPPAADPLTLYAAWEMAEYDITYLLNGGVNSANNPAVYTPDSQDIVLESPNKEGADFAGWYTDSLFTEGNKIEVIPHGSTGDLFLYAKWNSHKEKDPFEKDENDFWLIHNLQELQWMRDVVNSGTKTYPSDKYLLCANIYGEGAAWPEPIGSEAIPFNGLFEGYDYVIDGLQMSGSLQGIFGVIGSEGTIRNLKTINLHSDGNAEKAGSLAAINQGTIDKCSNGLNAGTAPLVIKGNHLTDISEWNNHISAETLAGGIVGENAGTIRNSNSNAIVSAPLAGGVAARNTGSISNSYNTGDLIAEKGTVGGIVGNNENGTLWNLYNCGNVKGLWAGAIIGKGQDGTVEKCYYTNTDLKACINQKIDAIHKSGSDMKTQAFVDLLNEAITDAGTYNEWYQSNVQNGGFPRIRSNILKPDTSEDSASNVIVQTLAVHPHASLSVTELEQDHELYQELLQKAEKENAKLLKVYNIYYMFPDGYSSDTEQNVMIHFPINRKWKGQKLSVLHRISDEEYQTLDGRVSGENLITTAEGLSTFAVFEYKKEVPEPDGPEVPTNPDNPSNVDPGSNNQKSGYIPVKEKISGTKTGDTSSVLPWVMLILLAGTIIIILVRKGKKYDREKEK